MCARVCVWEGVSHTRSRVGGMIGSSKRMTEADYLDRLDLSMRPADDGPRRVEQQWRLVYIQPGPGSDRYARLSLRSSFSLLAILVDPGPPA